MFNLNPYELHKLLINQYVLKKPGDTALLKRDTSKDRNDSSVIREHHRFLWNSEDETDSWELKFAKKYYDKLFKEYCIGDLSLYKENKTALRWRIDKEVIVGKGQFTCGNKTCNEKSELRTWEVNFGYSESGVKKNALVKIRLCPGCSEKLNYHTKKREVKRLHKNPEKKSKGKKRSSTDLVNSVTPGGSRASEESQQIVHDVTGTSEEVLESPWQQPINVDVKSREEEMEDYLNDLLL